MAELPLDAPDKKPHNLLRQFIRSMNCHNQNEDTTFDYDTEENYFINPQISSWEDLMESLSTTTYWGKFCCHLRHSPPSQDQETNVLQYSEVEAAKVMKKTLPMCHHNDKDMVGIMRGSQTRKKEMNEDLVENQKTNIQL